MYSKIVRIYCIINYEAFYFILSSKLTPREVARLQTFPDWYVFKGPYVTFHSNPEQDRYEQIGDAVPPLMAYKLGIEICNVLNNIENSKCH